MSPRRSNTSFRPWELIALAALLVAAAALRWWVIRAWVFAGSDSYGYLKLADELRLHHRYALGPDAPLHWFRPPLYPLFLWLSKGAAVAQMSGGDGWRKIEIAQAVLDVLVNLPLVWLMARRLAGPLAGVVALALASFFPFTLLWCGAVLTESLAATLATATLACLILGRARPRLWFTVGGVLLGLSTLLRPDGLLLGIAFVPAIWDAAKTNRARAMLAGLALAGFVVSFGPWPARNLWQFGAIHAGDGEIDRYGEVVPNHIGYMRWMRSFARDEVPTTATKSCFYLRSCSPMLEDYDRYQAFDDAAERTRVGELFAMRAREGYTAALSDGFTRLAAERQARHPMRSWVLLPLSRMWNMWIAPHIELQQHPRCPLRPFRHARELCGAFVFLMLLGGVLLWRQQASAAATLLLPIVLRTLVLGYTAYVMPRYVVQMMPIGCVLLVAGLWTLRPRRNAS